MAENATQRAQRLLDLVPFLKANPGISVSEVANRFDITKSEVLKDLNLLFLCGLPGYTHLELLDISFDDEIIHVVDAQNLGAPRSLTEQESLTLRIALLALLDALPSHDERRKKIQSLVKKLSQTFGENLPEGMIDVSQSHDQVVLSTIEEALRLGQRVEISYINKAKDSRSHRQVSPLRLIVAEPRLSLLAWCHQSEGVRTFSIPQIESAVLTDSPSVSIERVESDEAHQAKVAITGSGSGFITDFPGALMENSTIRYFNSEWLLKVGLSYGDEIEILTPHEVRGEIAKRAKAALALYR